MMSLKGHHTLVGVIVGIILYEVYTRKIAGGNGA